MRSATVMGHGGDVRITYGAGGGGIPAGPGASPARRVATAAGRKWNNGTGWRWELRMDAGTDFDRVLGLVYDAALDPVKWPDALGGLDRILRGPPASRSTTARPGAATASPAAS